MDESDDDEDNKNNNENGMNLNRLMNAFKFCLYASNQLVINNQSRTYYELGHLILNDVINIASTLRDHFMGMDTNEIYEKEFCQMIAIMHCNLASIYLHENKFDLALLSANKALQFDMNCIQSHRIRAQYYIKYKHDINCGLNDLYQILSIDEDHPYAINTKKEILKNNKLNNNIFTAKEIHNKNSINNSPCPRENHSAVSYRNDKLIIYGGCAINNKCDEAPLNDLWVLDINNNRWMQLDTIGITPCVRHSHSANIIQHKLYIIGGAKTTQIYNKYNSHTIHNTMRKKIYSKINSDYYHFERNRNRRLRNNALKMHRFSAYKNSSNPKERVFALNSTSNNGVTLETVVTFNNKNNQAKNKSKSKENINRGGGGGYALGGWFTNFFKHENDEKIKELTANGSVDNENENDNDTDSISMSSENTDNSDTNEIENESEIEIKHYEISRFPAIEMLDLKHNKWIRPETTGTSPKNIMINHRSIVVGKKIFIFPSNYSFPYELDSEKMNTLKTVSQAYVLYTDTLHWEAFEIPGTHGVVLSQQIVPVLYDKKDKIMFVSPFNHKYHIHCVLFTKSMQWSPIKKLPAMNKLSGYNRLTHFAYASFNNNYIVVHGGILKDKLYTNINGNGSVDENEKKKNGNNNNNQVHLLCKLPLETDAIYNVIDGTKKEYNVHNSEHMHDEYDEFVDEHSYDENDNELQPLYCVNDGNNNNNKTNSGYDSRVSIVESLLLNKNPSEIHRIGPIKSYKNGNENENMAMDDENENDECSYDNINKNNKKNMKRKISYETTTRTTTTRTGINKYKTTRTRTIRTTHHNYNTSMNSLKKKILSKKKENQNYEIDLDLLFNIKSSDISKYSNKLSFLSNFEIFDYISMQWLPRISISYSNKIYNNHFIEKQQPQLQQEQLDLLQLPRINHTITMVGNNLCIFGGTNSSNVLIIENFMQNTDKINKKFYKNYQIKQNKTKNKNESTNDINNTTNNNIYEETNALSLTKYLFGISPNIFCNGSYRMVQCANCLILECNRFNFRTCSGCAQVQYCSKLCQKNHWKLNHRHFCTKNHIRYQ